jgi:nucleotide-binding universal stress UspA family protein
VDWEKEDAMNETPVRPRIVVGIDGSDSSREALRWAARLATVLGADLDAVSAWELTSAYGWSALPPLYSPHSEVEKVLTDTVDQVFGADRPAGLRLRVLEGPAAARLIGASADAVMLVVGSRGRGGFAGLLLGSVSAKVAEHASCPVLVVHGSDQPATPGDVLVPPNAP